MQPATPLKLSVIIPVRNGGAAFRRCLEALAASSRLPDELLVVDDGSQDDSPEIARALGAQLLTNPSPQTGPGLARNYGASLATGDLLVFIDADVTVHPDTLAKMETYCLQHPEIDALFGSYDDAPTAPGYASQYKNLLHHHTHQHGRREASTFWAGCGAVRREVFLALGGFSSDFTRPSIEDIEFGMRLRQAGKQIALCPEIQCTHLKHWTFRSLIQTDIFQRAIPWSRLLAQSQSLPNDLNLDQSSRLSAIFAWAALLFLLLSLFCPIALPGAGLSFLLLGGLNRSFLALLSRRGSFGLLCVGFGLHWLYFLYSSLTFVVVTLSERYSSVLAFGYSDVQEGKTSQGQRLSPRQFALLLTALYGIVIAFGLYRHAMWRDEAQAWMIARDSHSLAELFQNYRFESHPILWYLGLFLVSRFTHDPLGMQILHGLIALSSLYLFARFAPFSRPLKVLYACGYFPLYEYALVSRGYGLGILLLFTFCVWYSGIQVFRCSGVQVFGCSGVQVFGCSGIQEEASTKNTKQHEADPQTHEKPKPPPSLVRNERQGKGAGGLGKPPFGQWGLLLFLLMNTSGCGIAVGLALALMVVGCHGREAWGDRRQRAGFLALVGLSLLGAGASVRQIVPPTEFYTLRPHSQVRKPPSRIEWTRIKDLPHTATRGYLAGISASSVPGPLRLLLYGGLFL